MPDVYATVTQLDAAMQERLVDVLETRGADPQQQAMRRAFLSDIAFPPQAHVLEVGCGTGVLAADLADAGHAVTGIDPAPAMLQIARTRPGGQRVRWLEGTAADLPDDDADLVVMEGHVAQYFLTDTQWAHTLGHIHRTLRPGGHVAFESRNPAARAWERWTREHTEDTYPHPDGGRASGPSSPALNTARRSHGPAETRNRGRGESPLRGR